MTIGIASVGELLVELVCGDKDGHHRRIGTYSGPYASGAPGIFIDQVARCGGRAIFVGAVGADAFGDVIRDRLIADGVDCSLVEVVPDRPTGSAFVSYNSDGSRDFVYNIVHSAASAFTSGAAVIDRLQAFGTGLVHVSGSALSSEAMSAKVLAICTAMHASGARIPFDPNVRKELLASGAYFAAVNSLIDICTYFLPSDADAETLYPGMDLPVFARALFDRGVEAVVLKRGEQGCAGIMRDGQRHDLPAHKVDIVDPTGAGDCFCATFVTMMASGTGFAEALALANAAGARAVTRVGPMEGNSSLADLRAVLAARS